MGNVWRISGRTPPPGGQYGHCPLRCDWTQRWRSIEKAATTRKVIIMAPMMTQMEVTSHTVVRDAAGCIGDCAAAAAAPWRVKRRRRRRRFSFFKCSVEPTSIFVIGMRIEKGMKEELRRVVVI